MQQGSQKRVRVLVVEDYEPFRRFVSSVIQLEGDLQVDREVADGMLAVEGAIELRPDLILLDIGLPLLSGIEAARRIVQHSPESKILFLTQESSPDLVREAFRLGAWGYVLKSDASAELLSAIRSVLRGTKFVSRSFFRQIDLSLSDPLQEGGI